ncbi:DUF4433 domain-containing protein [Clostridium frigoris]|uniref:DUF4433 domain-containing protein n=1 Tax=Clostridium frigoris TaxID=205327 RepID=A0ABS6BYY4_9CLOT|nr:DarT ssDNA thymidine ADP-ribosyltransferase family protein [Clostridium frigoris]MBU3161813.1 DUF4433 domain-containing protein [Clostridium frigoris]
MLNFINNRNISSLYHFTKLDNLNSILDKGLLSVEDLKRFNINYKNNDNLRLDGMLTGISLSISYPNYRMFYKYRNLVANLVANCDVTWCVIQLNPQLLIDKKCIFYTSNAATICFNPSGINGLQSLFYENDSRLMYELTDEFTTDPQAEVIVLGEMEPTYIKSIKFNTPVVNFPENFDFKKYKEKYTLEFDNTVFSYRKDYAYWRK